MWIHQRTGPDTGVSYRLGTLVFGVLALAGIAGQIGEAISPAGWILLAVLAACVGLLYLWGRAVTKDQRSEQREYERLAALERMETARNKRDAGEAAQRADLARLREKYQVPNPSKVSAQGGRSTAADRLAQRFRERDL